MKKYLLAITLLCSATLCAQKEWEVFYFQVDSCYLEACVNEALRFLHKDHNKIKSVQYNDIDANIASFMIVYEKKR